jgi:ribosomal protein S18 acetylase RimI-like enzyme
MVQYRNMIERPQVFYAREERLDVAEFRQVLMDSGLGSHRPVEDDTRLAIMLASANVILTARLGTPEGPLVGVARGVTDFAWCCYISELAVAQAAQGLGLGKGLLDEIRRELGPQVSIILASMPEAVRFYERIGMARVPDAFWFKREL